MHGNFDPGAGKVQQLRVNACEGEINRGQAGVGNGGEAGLRHRKDGLRRSALPRGHGGYGPRRGGRLKVLRVDHSALQDFQERIRGRKPGRALPHDLAFQGSSVESEHNLNMRGDTQLVGHGAGRRKRDAGERDAAQGFKHGERDRLLKLLGAPLPIEIGRICAFDKGAADDIALRVA